MTTASDDTFWSHKPSHLSKDELKKMRVKQLRTFLYKRGVKCEVKTRTEIIIILCYSTLF